MTYFFSTQLLDDWKSVGFDSAKMEIFAKKHYN